MTFLKKQKKFFCQPNFLKTYVAIAACFCSEIFSFRPSGGSWVRTGTGRGLWFCVSHYVKILKLKLSSKKFCNVFDYTLWQTCNYCVFIFYPTNPKPSFINPTTNFTNLIMDFHVWETEKFIGMVMLWCVVQILNSFVVSAISNSHLTKNFFFQFFNNFWTMKYFCQIFTKNKRKIFSHRFFC